MVDEAVGGRAANKREEEREKEKERETQSDDSAMLYRYAGDKWWNTRSNTLINTVIRSTIITPH